MATTSDKNADTNTHAAGRDLQHDRPSVTNRPRDVRSPGDREGLDGFQDQQDERIGAVVADTLARSDELDATQVLVAARDGVVTLTGEVPEAAMKDCAARVARSIPGVQDVRNVISVDDGSASFGPPGKAVRSDY